MIYIAITSSALAVIFAIKYRLEKIRFKGLMFFIVEKEYTPPNELEMMECIKIVARKTAEEWLK